MPLRDDDGPFVVASVAVRGVHPEITSVEGRPRWLCTKLVELGAFANCSLVRPCAGYGLSIGKKLEKMDVMARATRLMTGANAQYLTQNGLQQRYVIYSHCMQDVVQGPILRAVSSFPVEHVEIYLDEMTMAPGTRRLLRTHVRSMNRNLVATIERLQALSPSHAASLRANLRFDEIRVAWSNEEESGAAKDGLRLAHYLASLTYHDLVHARSDLSDSMTQCGYQNYIRDITPQLVRPISQETIARWEQNSGLSEPEI